MAGRAGTISRMVPHLANQTPSWLSHDGQGGVAFWSMSSRNPRVIKADWVESRRSSNGGLGSTVLNVMVELLLPVPLCGGPGGVAGYNALKSTRQWVPLPPEGELSESWHSLNATR
eukprot:CAMPEP_0195591276 /NCGR_PEP_ID=MMETSP0814-20130614/34563_1 /TAXON_ID=97485 /ORGANISM="Prymnesium parvum, Strain Texoma1" /LENGTH=115 /DNA_ID=CAMNT_0040730319 /DNA_START=265 /DNA_END=613 /DNA_ORIENTATION=+